MTMKGSHISRETWELLRQVATQEHRPMIAIMEEASTPIVGSFSGDMRSLTSHDRPQVMNSFGTIRTE